MSAIDSTPVIFVDDDEDVRAANCQTLRLAGLSPLGFARAESALKTVTADFPGVVVSDIRMPGMDGRRFFQQVRAIDAAAPVILITGHGDIAEAVQAMKDGAYDFIAKPFPADRLVSSVRRALEARAQTLAARQLKAMAQEAEAQLPLIGADPAFAPVRAAISAFAQADIDVLATGEAGVGKETIVRAVHQAGPRRGRPFVAVRCALGEEEAEAALFGVAGPRPRRSQIETCDGGAIYLEDVDLLAPRLQAKLWRVIADREVRPTGSDVARPVDVRVHTSATSDIDAQAAAGGFRRDLFDHLCAGRIRAPALRDRRGDVMGLFACFAADAAARFQRPAPMLSDDVREWLLKHDWPGNVRELAAFAERAVLGLDPLPDDAAPDAASLSDRVDHFERALIQHALAESGGDIRRTLEALRVPRKTLYDKIKRHQIDLRAFRIRE